MAETPIDDVKPGKFNQMMNQIIGELAQDDDEDNDGQQMVANIDQAPRSDDRWNRSSLAQSTENLPPHMLTQLSHQYLSLPASNAIAIAPTILPAMTSSIALDPSDPLGTALNSFYKDDKIAHGGDIDPNQRL